MYSAVNPRKWVVKYVEMAVAIARSKPLKACASMTLGLCFHFLGYECARAASITLLAAKDAGFGNEAIPLTIALGSPLSGLVLYLYSKSIKKFGSKFTLRISFAAVIVFMSIITAYGRSMKGLTGKILIVAFYAFREIYVSLLSSQQWAFIAGTLNKGTSSYIVTFSGVVSVASAVGGCLIEQLVKLGGVQALLLTALLSCVVSCFCAEFAYTLSDVQAPAPSVPTDHTATTTTTATDSSTTTTENRTAAGSMQRSTDANKGMRQRMDSSDKTHQHSHSHQNQLRETTHENNRSNGTNKSNITHKQSNATTDKTTVHNNTPKKKSGFWADSWNLIRKHPMLQILFIEGILHQLCGNMLNLMFHNGLRMEIADDATRARLVGRFFATVSITSCTVQCFVLPHILSHATLPSVLAKMPVFVLAAALFGVISPGLVSVMAGFGTIKVLEYSIMHSASEMIYMPMGHEVRYLGKELIRYFGHKLGKSASSLVLSALVSQLQPSLAMQSVWGALLTLCWGGSMLLLAQGVRDRDQEEEAELQRSAAARAARAQAADVKTRKKARSFSLDDSVVKYGSNSRAMVRVQGIPAIDSAGMRNRKATGVAGSADAYDAVKAVGERQVRAVSAHRDGTSAPCSSGFGHSRSVSLDHRCTPPRSAHKALLGLSTTTATAGSAVGLVEEEIPTHPGVVHTSLQKDGASCDLDHDNAAEDYSKSAPAATAEQTSTAHPPELDGDGLDTATDVSGSPEASLPSARSHGGSLDSVASLGQDFERGESFSEVAVGRAFRSSDLGITGIEEGEEGEMLEQEWEGEGGKGNFSVGFASTNSLASIESRERRESWEREQRRRERADDVQPVMLRVGSVSVSLNTLNERAARRGREQRREQDGSPESL